VINDFSPSYRIRAQVSWVYDEPPISHGGQAYFHPEGTITMEFYKPDPCSAIVPPSFTVTAASDPIYLIIDSSTTPPTYTGAGSTLWQASYVDKCKGNTLPSVTGGVWFSGKGTVSADGNTIAGTQSSAGQTFTFNFAKQ
jgi:hypothetical protein